MEADNTEEMKMGIALGIPSVCHHEPYKSICEVIPTANPPKLTLKNKNKQQQKTDLSDYGTKDFGIRLTKVSVLVLSFSEGYGPGHFTSSL